MKPTEKMVELRRVLLCCVIAFVTLAACGKKEDPIAQAEPAGPAHPGIEEVKSIMEEAYIYGFPMIAAFWLAPVGKGRLRQVLPRYFTPKPISAY
jgi:hypothetical protein